MENEKTTEVELTTALQVTSVVLCALAGYVAGRLTSAGFTAGVRKFQTIRANRSE